MKKYVYIIIGIAIGWLISFSSCTNPLIANNNESNTVGKYAVAVTGGGDVSCIIINTETGEIFNKIYITAYEFQDE